MPRGIPLHPKSTEERFWSKVARGSSDSCWRWLGSRNPQGYGYFWSSDERRMVFAHRAAYVLAGGCLESLTGRGRTAPRPTVIRHTCDNPACVNPSHLVIGTHRDNSADAIDRGRLPDKRGASNPNAKFTQAEVDEIRASYTGRYGEIAALSRRYGRAVDHIVYGRCW